MTVAWLLLSPTTSPITFNENTESIDVTILIYKTMCNANIVRIGNIRETPIWIDTTAIKTFWCYVSFNINFTVYHVTDIFILQKHSRLNNTSQCKRITTPSLTTADVNDYITLLWLV